MTKHLIGLALLIPGTAFAQPMASTYAGRDGRISTVVIACPSQDGTFTAGPCTMTKPGIVTYAAPAISGIAVANVPVTVFAAGSVQTGCDVVNTGTTTLYIDLTTTAAIGSATSLPLLPGQAFHCPYPPSGGISAVATAAQPFVAIRY